VVLLVVDLAVVSYVVVTIMDQTARWSSYLILFSYAGLTWQFGWGFPKTVDKWQAQNDSGPRDSP